MPWSLGHSTQHELSASTSRRSLIYEDLIKKADRTGLCRSSRVVVAVEWGPRAIWKVISR